MMMTMNERNLMVGKLLVTNGEGKGLYCVIKEGDESSVGRNLECSIPVPDIKLSRIHCIIRNEEGTFQILDNNSRNGTYLNGKKIELMSELKDGDVIEIGDTKIKFSCQDN